MARRSPSLTTPRYFKKRSALVPPEFSYEGEYGPEAWGEIPAYPLCRLGKEQSPIRLPAAAIPVSGPALALDYLAPRSYRVQRDAHGVSVFPEEEAHLDLDGTLYRLEHAHFHTPAEHTLQGEPEDVRFPMEIHLVHYSKDELEDERLTEFPRPIIPVVVALWVEPAAGDANLGNILTHMPKLPGKESNTVPLDLAGWFTSPGYFHYVGSLTTPPCTEGVRFFVMRAAVPASVAQVGRFHSILGMNNRPIQPLNERVVYEFRDSAGG